MYQWTHHESSSSTNVPGKIEAGALWPPHGKLNYSPTKRQDGESKIPKLVSTFTSTPKPPRPSSLGTPENLILLNGTESDQKKVAEMRQKLNKCDTLQEALLLIRGFLSEYAMQSSESSNNSSAAMTSSLINGTESIIFDKQDQQKLINILQNQKNVEASPRTPIGSSRIIRTPPKSRTTPSTPTRSTDLKGRIRRNLSSDSVSSTPIKNDAGCKKCMLNAATKKTKTLVDKATIMDVEPIEFPKQPTMIDVEIQTEAIDSEGKKEEVAAAIPQAPPMPPPMNLAPVPPPPPPPMINCPKPPGN